MRCWSATKRLAAELLLALQLEYAAVLGVRAAIIVLDHTILAVYRDVETFALFKLAWTFLESALVILILSFPVVVEIKGFI